MTSADKKKLLKTNALLWVGAMLICGLVLLSIEISEGRVSKAILGFLIVVTMWSLAMASNTLVSKAVGTPSDERGADTV
jgi:glycerol uptake facilitator-like aquaporin